MPPGCWRVWVCILQSQNRRGGETPQLRPPAVVVTAASCRPRPAAGTASNFLREPSSCCGGRRPAAASCGSAAAQPYTTLLQLASCVVTSCPGCSRAGAGQLPALAPETTDDAWDHWQLSVSPSLRPVLCPPPAASSGWLMWWPSVPISIKPP